MARSFDASSGDYLDAGNPAALNLTGDQVTVAARIMLASVNGEQKFFAKWADSGDRFQYLLSVNSDDHLIFAIYSGSVAIAEGTTALVANTWYHAGGVYDGSVVRAYLNGTEEAATAKTGNMPSTTAPLRIGGGSSGENPFDGTIAHPALWPTARSGGEMKTLAAGASPLQLPLGAFYAPLNGRDPEYDVIGGLALTVNGSDKAEEPPIPNSIVAP